MARMAARSVARAASQPGRRMRSLLLDAAAALFIARGFADVSVAEIAEAAGAFPSQVTYYFGSKEALFVEAACREILYVARGAEAATASARDLDTYLDRMVAAIMGAPGLKLFVEALALAQRRPEFSGQMERTFERLDHEGDRALHDYLVRSGGPAHDSAIPARRFWAIAIGMGARAGALGEPAEMVAAEVRELVTPALLATPATRRPRQGGRPGKTEETQDTED